MYLLKNKVYLIKLTTKNLVLQNKGNFQRYVLILYLCIWYVQSCVCIYVCKWGLKCYSTHVLQKGKCQILTLVFPLVWSTDSNYFLPLVHARMSGTQVPVNFSVYNSRSTKESWDWRYTLLKLALHVHIFRILIKVHMLELRMPHFSMDPSSWL